MSNRSPQAKAVIEALGGVVKTARTLGLTVPAVSKWVSVPKRHDARITELTGKTLAQFKQETSGNGNDTQ